MIASLRRARASSTTARSAARASCPTSRAPSTSSSIRLVLHHVVYQGPLAPVFEEAARLLRPGGALVAVEPGLWHPVGAGLALANRAGLGPAVHGTPDDIPLSPRMLVREARRSGLEPELHAVTFGWRRLPAAGAARAPRARRRGLAAAARAVRPHAHADRPWLAATTTSSGSSCRRTRGRRPSSCARFVRSLGHAEQRARPRLRRRPADRRARRRASSPRADVSRVALERARRRLPRRAASPSSSRTPRCRSTTARSTSSSAPRRSSTCATCSCCCRRRGACCGPAARSRSPRRPAAPLMRPPGPALAAPALPHARARSRALLDELGFDVRSLERRAGTLLARATR